MAEAEAVFHVIEKKLKGVDEEKEKETEVFHSLPPTLMEINTRIRALVDIGDFLLGFTIEDIGGGHAPRARVFDLHTRAWLPTPVPILPSVEEGEELPIDGRWQMQMIDYTTILCIYSNPSRCRLIYLHLDRTPTQSFPLSLFVSHSRDIRPEFSILLDKSLNCTVFYERKDGVERVSIVTDDYQYDRDSVRVHEESENGQIVEIGTVNLANTTDDFMMARCAEGNILMTRKRGEGILIDRKTGSEQIVKVVVDQDEAGPFFKSESFTLVDGRSLAVDCSGSLWSLDGNDLQWRKHSMKGFPNGDIYSLNHTWNGRLLCLQPFKRKPKKGEESNETFFQPLWRWIQPASLKDLAQSKVREGLPIYREETTALHRDMEIHRRDYDTTTAFVMAIQKKQGR